ncbi:hypothetical protein PGB34_14730 [Xenophilus arseniciresistens]|uniref:Uncharacterized protein n=1 Tax=Xenophilus arseniciresistens TaxID=1283306 RepID=A0AAE3N7U0_9BURK|nr:hypothetical protein [Xenophilus arseniciresistens]MDA7417615.1 hypothetical protein [Xenophilus arseniciresistens]
MKAILILATALAAGSVFAQSADRSGGGGGNPHTTPVCTTCEGAGIYVGASLTQTTTVRDSLVKNVAEGGWGSGEAKAVQNISSNTYGVKIGAATRQTTSLNDALVINVADGSGATAGQNLSSNMGAVHVNASLTQSVSASAGSAIVNMAKGKARAVQNLSSNNACEACL